MQTLKKDWKDFEGIRPAGSVLFCIPCYEMGKKKKEANKSGELFDVWMNGCLDGMDHDFGFYDL